jgi:FkbM family methyltransferase
MQKKIKPLLKKFPFIYKTARNFYRIFVPAPKSRIEKIQERIQQELQDQSAVFFIQVGANDGVRGDPLRRLILENENWTGIFVEPLIFYFQQLKNNYHNASRFVFENVAIASEPGRKQIFYVSRDAETALGNELPSWFYGLGSFERSHILNHLAGLGEKIEPYIVEEEIEAIPLQTLLDRNGVARIDVLNIDTEGFDYKVLSQVNFERYKPLVVLYEHKHLSADERNRANLLLTGRGYECVEYGGDTLAICDVTAR